MDSSSYYQSNLLYAQESLSKYRPGGYHPVTLGDTFQNGRYKVHHKLGWGGFSTVWLVHDQSCNQWVALKIMTANSHESQELQNLEYLKSQTRENLSSHFVVQLLDSFCHEGPNGAHQCLVFELLGPSVDRVLADYQQAGDQLCPEIIRRMSRQVLEAVRFLHSVGMCHGDISGRNIAFSCSQLSKARGNDLFAVLGSPEIEPLSRLDGMPLPDGFPTQLVKAAEWVDWIDEDDEDIRLLDFGESFLQGNEPHHLAQPGSLRVPETIFTDHFDYSVDLWRVGCAIYSFLFASTPFWYLGEVDVLVFQMIGFVEELPVEWQSKWESMQKESKHDLEVDQNRKLPDLDRRFNEKMHEPVLAPLLEAIRGLMRFLPSRRISASDALDILENSSMEV